MRDPANARPPRKLVSTIVLAALTGLIVTMSPTSADAPIIVTDERTFDDVNPCTSEVDTISLFFTVYIHDHKNNFVVHVQRNGITASGYTLLNGQEQFVDNSQVITAHFKDIWLSADGSMFEAAGRFLLNVNQGDVKVDSLALRCIHT